ncbi:MAG: hypothetical protein KAS66_00155 [Candidatus Omnitrophica bacterium]|nr:hypothetical protein [Candidatus Omnitrophota bacterium]
MSYDFPKLHKESRDTNGWIKGCCPIHDDKSPSFSYDPETGAWVCFSQCGKGNYQQFLELYDPAAADRNKESKKKTPAKKAKKKAAPAEPAKPPIPEGYVKKCTEQLNDQAVQYLYEKRGLTIDTIKQYEIGWDPDLPGGRNTIPIRDENGKLVNIRRYNAKKGRWKMMPYNQRVKGKDYTYGSPARLYGLDELVKYKEHEVIICEGEFDRLLLQQNGFMAVTTTNGCKSFLAEWVRFFKGKDVVILQDCDDGGQVAAKGLLLPMFENSGVRSIKNILLPLEGTSKDNDITDYFHAHGFTAKDLRTLIDETPVHAYEYELEGSTDPITVLESFVEIEDHKHVDQRIQCEIVVSGETSDSFYAVSEFEVDHCKTREDSKCSRCIRPITIPISEQEYIGSCMSTNPQVVGMLRSYCCKFDKKPTIKITRRVTVQEFFAHQTIKRSKSGGKMQELVEKKCYYISSNDAPPGSYLATGYAKAHPKTQAITFLIETLIPQEDDYQSFDVTKEIEHLKAYQKFSLPEIIEDLTNGVTNIYERDELLMAVLLTFFSPLWINFNKNRIRGWILSIIIGDSGLGKTQTYNRISDYIGAGDFFSCLTGSRTGLSYALVEDHRRGGWQIKIGRYPANSGKLLAVDEVQHLQEFDLQSISKAMDEGFMQIDRVKSRGYDSMTRLLMMCNPKYDRVMDECMYGCETLKTIYPPTILRRVDFAVFANSGDMMDYSVMNRKNTKLPKITPSMLRSAVFFAWTRTEDQIFFDPEAEEYCLSQALILSKEFGNAVDIPLVAPSDFRYNLARISTALAFIVMSTENFETVTVKKEHVEAAIDFIGCIYRHQSASLDKYSEIVKLKTHLLNFEELETAFMKKRKTGIEKNRGNFFVKTIYHLRISTSIKRDDLKDFVGCGLDTIKKVVSFLKKYHLIRSGKNGYQKQPKFVKFLRELERTHPDYFNVMEMPDPDEEDDDNPGWG